MFNNFAPFNIISIDAQSDDETTGVPVYVLGAPYVAVVVQGNGTTSSGVVTIEQASYNANTEQPYGGTWSSITTVNASDASGDTQKVIMLPPEAYCWIRARISTAIGGGGTITVRIQGF